MPVTWDEVEAATRGAPLMFTLDDATRRLDEQGDLFA
jgi:DNA primase